MTSDGAPAPSHALGWRLEGTPAVLDALTTTVLPDLEGALARGTPLRRTQQRRVARLTLVPPAGASLRHFVLIDDTVTHEVRNHIVYVVTQGPDGVDLLGMLQYPARRLAIERG